MTDEDPRPLKSSGETPPELARALRALSRDRDAARLARVAERLSVNLSTPATPSWLDKLGGAKLGLAGLLLGVGAGVLGYVLLASRDARPAQPPTPSVETPAPAAEPLPAEPASEPELPSPPTAATPKPKPTRAARPVRARSEAPTATSSTPAAAAPSAAPAPAPAPEPARAEATAERPKPEAEPQAEQAAVQAPKRASELGLLQQARKAAADAPDDALRLLQEHAERFPAGMLTPEREVLSIEVLRKLGRSREAAERLEQFEKRYPSSIYLRRLQRTAGHDL